MGSISKIEKISEELRSQLIGLTFKEAEEALNYTLSMLKSQSFVLGSDTSYRRFEKHDDTKDGSELEEIFT